MGFSDEVAASAAETLAAGRAPLSEDTHHIKQSEESGGEQWPMEFPGEWWNAWNSSATSWPS